MDTFGQRRRFLGATAALALGTATTFAATRVEPRVIEVVAKKFEFVPGEIRLQRGETVTLQFSAPEVPMGFTLPEYRQRIDIFPGRTTSLELTANKAGTFTFLCDVFCGTGHEDMSGTLIVA